MDEMTQAKRTASPCPRILDSLDSTRSRATFFRIVEEALQFPEMAQEIHARGHEIASHSTTHRLPFAGLSESRMWREVVESKRPWKRSRVRRSWDSEPQLGRVARPAVGSDPCGVRIRRVKRPVHSPSVARRAVAKRSARGMQTARSDSWSGAPGPARPHRLDPANGSIWRS